MGISLYGHNQTAYDAALSMLEETGKAAVVHPTGTGKSFIAFHLAEEHPTAKICWLSPSEYIYRTQVENLKQAGGGVPSNILFFTYAKLMLLSKEELGGIRPDYIILDEFHRCGAEQWGAGVSRLLEQVPGVPILGLSATNIRYLDNQRDMADELFQGNIASEMTLGEAIVRGILNPPKYVLSVYAYQKDLERYKRRIHRAKSKAVRDKAEEDLEALRRALEKADGLEELFDKHMTERQGKYIVFCANVEHMREMKGKALEWFSKVDTKPHIYTAYSNDPETSRAFAKFKGDKSGHLKLLFCIDMLNEGIHVEDISGVILLRPTVSPIIYKQQIGRALSANKKKEAVIFDIVMNISNLYSIGAIEDEMRVAMTYYRFLGKGKEIVNDRFRIIDEVEDCRQLFERLDETLTASWELMYEYAKAYYEEHGNLEVPRRYQTKEGYSLGNWLTTQRKVYRGEQYGNLGEERVTKLEAIGMIWESRGELSWKKYYGEAEAYYREHGDLDAKVNYVTAGGVALGRWLGQLRTYRKSGVQTTYLSEARIEALNQLGMIWSVPDYNWERNYNAALRYYREQGDLEVPAGYTDRSGVKLGMWLNNMRCSRKNANSGYRLTEEQIQKLDEIGMRWTNKHDMQWEVGYQEAVQYYNKHQNLNVPATYISESGYPLGKWLRKHTEKNKKTGQTTMKVTPERRAKLEKLGMCWTSPADPWEVRYALAEAYYKEHGNLNVPHKYIVEGVWLNKWLNEQRQIYYGRRPGKRLTQAQVERLEAISFDWQNRSSRAWEERYTEAKRYYEEHGHLPVQQEIVDAKSKRLASWISIQRKNYRQGKLNHTQVQKLTAIGMVWDTKRNRKHNDIPKREQKIAKEKHQIVNRESRL